MWTQILLDAKSNLIYMLQLYGKSAILPSILFGFCYGLLSLYVFPNFIQKRRTKRIHVKDKLLACYRGTFATLLAFYIYILLFIVFFSRVPGPLVINMKFLGTYRGHWSLIFFFENSIMLFPLGFLIPKVIPFFQKAWRTTLLGLVTSVTIEIVQYYTRLGYMELDDMWTNTLGCYVGYLAHWITYIPVFIYWAYKKYKKKQKK